MSFAGALQYREYDLMTRLVMRVLMRRGEHPTDVAHDYDYTDWDSVDPLADERARMLASPSGSAQAWPRCLRAIDGAVTTFAVVVGRRGRDLTRRS